MPYPLNIQRPNRTLAAPAVDPVTPMTLARPVKRTLASPIAATTSRPVPQENRTLSGSGSANTSSSPIHPATDGTRPSLDAGGGGGATSGASAPGAPFAVPRPQRTLQDSAAAAEVPAIRRPGTFKRTLNSGVGKFGEPVYDNASIERIGSRPGVMTQSFGTLSGEGEAGSAINRTLPTKPTYNPQNDPRMQDSGAQRPYRALRGADVTAEAHNSREDREARQRLASELGSQMFRLGIGGMNSRSKREAFAELAKLQAQLVGGGERLASEAIQSRAGRNATLATTGLEQAGQDRRALQAAQAGALEGDANRAQQLGIARMQDATRRGELDQGETITAADGRVFQIGSDGNATAVKDADGNQVRMPVARDTSALSVHDQLDSLANELKAATDQLTAMQGVSGTATPDQVQQQLNYVSRLQGELAELRGGGAGNEGTGGTAGNNGNRARPNWEQFQARAKAQGSRMTPEQLRAYYDSMQQ